MSLYDRVAGLRLTVERCRLEHRSRVVATSAFTRTTTLVHLEGRGHSGCGEDVSFDAADHEALTPAGVLAAVRGVHTVDSFSQLLGAAELWPRAPRAPTARSYRRWAFESAALDLALRQAGLTLAQALGRTARPVRFVSSFRLGEPPQLDILLARLRCYPGLRLKLDATPSWDDALIASLAATGAVDTIDLKGIARGTAVDQPPDPALYARVADGLPGAWIEDPALTEETLAVLAPHWARVTWDAPVGGPGDLDRLPRRPPMINVKPSRFGTVARLLDTYDRCAADGIDVYGGGQFELGPGRGQIQRLAALLHPDAPNDVAPPGYNDPLLAPGLPVSPLALAPGGPGF